MQEPFEASLSTQPYFHFVYLGSDRYYIPGEGVLEGNILKYTKCEAGRDTGLAFSVKVVNLYYDWSKSMFPSRLDKQNSLKRPVTKLCLLEGVNDE